MGATRFAPVWGVTTGQPQEHETEERPGRGGLRVPADTALKVPRR